MWVTQLDVWSLERLAELWVVKRDLKASDFSSMSWIDLLVAEAAKDLEHFVELEAPEGPATAGREKDTAAGWGMANKRDIRTVVDKMIFKKDGTHENLA